MEELLEIPITKEGKEKKRGKKEPKHLLEQQCEVFSSINTSKSLFYIDTI